MITIHNLTKIYNANRPNELKALDNISLKIKDGESIAIMGRSGAGKSTLLHILAGIDSLSSGQIFINNFKLHEMEDVSLANFRNKEIGLILQDFFLIKEGSVLDNVMLPLNFIRMKNKKRLEKASNLIHGVDLGNYIHKPVMDLSGGEKQRVAIARALVNDPQIILADEPTGSLDSKTSNDILNMLLRINSTGKTLIIITHDNEIAKLCDTIIELSDGKII